jgi:serine/threonine protein kinase
LDGTPWEPGKAAGLVEILARTMQAAHEQGIIHRDLKPGNVLLACSQVKGGIVLGSGTGAAHYEPKIADFGLAKRVGSTETTAATHTGAVMGTPSYMAPEQARGKTKEIGPLVNVYALGAIFYELLAGRPPFKGPTSLDAVLLVIAEEVVPPRRLLPKLPKDLETICLKCLQKEPAKRYENALALAEDLKRFLSGQPIAARPAGRLSRAGDIPAGGSRCQRRAAGRADGHHRIAGRVDCRTSAGTGAAPSVGRRG